MTPREKAAAAVIELKAALLDYLRSRPNGVRHIEIVEDLGLRSDYEGKQRNYLSWSILGMLLAEGSVRYERRDRTKFYYAQ